MFTILPTSEQSRAEVISIFGNLLDSPANNTTKHVYNWNCQSYSLQLLTGWSCHYCRFFSLLSCLGLAGNQPRSTRPCCSKISLEVQKLENAKTPRRVCGNMASTNNDAAVAASPRMMNHHQHRVPNQ